MTSSPNNGTSLVSRIRSHLDSLSLQSRFLLIMGVSSLFFGLLNWAVFDSFTESLVARIGQRFTESQTLYSKAHTLQPLVSEIPLVRQTANDPLVEDWVANERDETRHKLAIAQMRRNFSGHDYFVALTDSNTFYYDNHIQQRRYALDPTSADDAWFFDFVKSNKNQYVRIATDSHLGVSRIWVMVPIRANNKSSGVVGIGIDLHAFAKNTYTRLPGITSMIIDRNTAIQIYNGADRVDFPSVPSYQDQPRPSNVVVGSQRNRQWILQAIESLGSASQKVEIGFLQIDGKRYLAGMSTLPELSWYHLTLLDTSMLLPQLDFIRMVLVVVTSTLLLLAIMALSLHRLVLEPSARLADVVSRIHRGDYTSRPVRESSEEARELALKVRDMAAAIENTQHWLETEIEKRTHQLSDAREMLEISLQHERNGREIQANLMALMSHEMRSPVAVIGNTAQMLRVLAQSEHPDMLPRIEKIMRSVRQLSALMGTFLSEKWLDMDKHGPNLKPGNLNQVCAEIARKPSEHSSHAVRFEPWIGDTSLHADWKLIEIAITNLLDNARKYSVSNDEILLRVLPGGNDMLCLEVCNHGARIPPELQARIFEKYARGQHDGDVHGSGLGLYLVSWIAKFHGGYTEVSSSEGENNAFRLYLPRHDPLSLPAPSQ